MFHDFQTPAAAATAETADSDEESTCKSFVPKPDRVASLSLVQASPFHSQLVAQGQAPQGLADVTGVFSFHGTTLPLGNVHARRVDQLTKRFLTESAKINIREAVESPSTGGAPWVSSIVFASLAASPMGHDMLAGRTVIELGAGVGLASAAAAAVMPPPRAVLATDACHKCIEVLRDLPGVTAARLAWGGGAGGRRFDVVVACDLFYRPDCSALLRTVLEVVHEKSNVVVVSPVERPGLTPFLYALGEMAEVDAHVVHALLDHDGLVASIDIMVAVLTFGQGEDSDDEAIARPISVSEDDS